MRALTRLLVSLTAALTVVGLAAPAYASTDRNLDPAIALSRARVATGSAGLALPTSGDTVRAGDLTIRYPRAASRSKALGSYTRVFDGPRFDQVVQSTGGGDVRMMTVIAGPSSPTRYEYTFEGRTLRQVGQGYVAVYRGGEPTAVIAPAWAVDARGRSVPTRYTVSGDTLTQVVDLTAATAFPVVADPSVKFSWWGFEVRYNWRETSITATGSAGCATVAALIPDPTASKAVAVSCGLVSLWARTAQSRGKCIAMKKPWVGPLVPWYWSCPR